jgi:hypothetical protein
MSGVRKASKTVTSLALANMYDEEGVTTIYHGVMEPRTPGREELCEPDAWQRIFNDLLTRAGGGVLVVDSLTYLVAQLQKVQDMAEHRGSGTYKGGLNPIDILGVQIHDALALKYDVAVIATINSELYPVIDVMEGACEGKFDLTGYQIMKHRERSSRKDKEFIVPREFVELAFAQLKLPMEQFARSDSNRV